MAVNRMEHSKISLGFDGNQAISAIDELKLHAVNISDELRQCLLRLFNPLDKLFVFECGTTVGASQTITLKPSDLFLDLLIAARAGQLDKFIVKVDGAHNRDFLENAR